MNTSPDEKYVSPTERPASDEFDSAESDVNWEPVLTPRSLQSTPTTSGGSPGPSLNEGEYPSNAR